MRSWMVAFSLGIFLAGFIPRLPHPAWLVLCLVVPLLALRVRIFYLAGAYSLGLGWALWWGLAGLRDRLPEALERQDIWVRGEVVGLPQSSELSQRFLFKVESWCPAADLSACRFTAPARLKRKIRLNHYGEETIEPGQRWRVKVRLIRPHGFANPGGFDYEAWLLQQGISATGYIRADPGNRLLPGTGPPGFSRLRFEFRRRLEKVFSVPEEVSSAPEELSSTSGELSSDPKGNSPLRQGGLIKALTIGDRYDITDGQWALFTATGTNHLMVISGLHVGLVALLGNRLILLLMRLIPALMLAVPSPRLGAAAAVLAAFFYSGLAGFSLPTLRAFIMVAALMCGRLTNRATAPWSGLCLALGLVLLADPLAPQSAGFWLSFGAVAVLIRFATASAGPASQVSASTRAWNTLDADTKKKRWPDMEPAEHTAPGFSLSLWRQGKTLVGAQLFLFAGLFPLMLVFFQQASLLAPWVNLFAIPLVGLLVVPLCLAGVAVIGWWPALARTCFLAADFLLELLLSALEAIVRHFPHAVLELPALPGWGVAVMAAGAVWLLAGPKVTRSGTHAGGLISCYLWKGALRAAGIMGLLPLALARAPTVAQGEFLLHVLDVGQGLAVVVQTANHTLLYDAGPAYSPRFNAGSGIVMPFLRAGNLNRLDRVVISHGDTDHAGGLPIIAGRFADAVYFGGDRDFTPPYVDLQACREGTRWQWDGVTFRFLHPDARRYASNDASCVLKISADPYAALLPGDIEGSVEDRLSREASAALRADILVAPHHGSNTSSSPAFIRGVAPRYVVFSSGYQNRFNHPHPDVAARYRGAGVEGFNTASLGALSFRVSPQHGIDSPSSWRNKRRRYWGTIEEADSRSQGAGH